MTEPVSAQRHYTVLTPEALDVIEAWERQGALGHHAACALKYIARHRHHGTPRRDIEKAIDYLRRLLARDYPEEAAPQQSIAAAEKRNCDTCRYQLNEYHCARPDGPCSVRDNGYPHWEPRESPPDEQAQEAACDDDEAMDLPPGWEHAFQDAIHLGPREPRSKSEQKRVEVLRAAQAGEYRVDDEHEPSKYGREQRVPGRRYRKTPSGRNIPICDHPGCDYIARSKGLCRRHGG